LGETSSKVTATTVIFQAWNLCSYLKNWRACLLNNEEKVELSKQSTSCNIILESMHDYVVISKEDVRMYVVLSKAQKHVLYGKLAGNLERIML